MRRLTAGEVLAVAAGAGAGFTETRSFAFMTAPAHVLTARPARIEGIRRSIPVSPAQQGDGGKDEACREDDQRRFWDTVVEILTQELGTGDQLSRVWEFVRHNKDGDDPPTESPSYRATGLYFPGLEAKPWWDRSEFPWLQNLEAVAPDITREMEALARAGSGTPYRGGSGEMSTVYDATQGWGTMRLRYMGRFSQPGINYSLLPRTLSALRRLPLAPETAAFQRQLPGTGLPLHVDPSNFVLGCHLGVVIPSPPRPVAPDMVRAGASGAMGGDRRRSQRKRASNGGGGGFGFGGGVSASAGLKGKHTGAGRGGDGGVEGSTAAGATGLVTERKPGDPMPTTGSGVGGGVVGEPAWIEVSGEKRHWQTGRAFVFDPSFLHRTSNPTAGERVILNVDIWHPGLSEVEKAAIARVCEMVEEWNTRTGLFQ